jgi:hypothetical protein
MSAHILQKLENINFQEIKRLLGNIILYSFRMYGLFVLIILALYILIKNKKQIFSFLFPLNTWVLFISMISAGLFAHTLLFCVTDIQQLHQNFFMSFFNIVLFLLFSFSIKYKQYIISTVCVILFGITFLIHFINYQSSPINFQKYSILKKEFKNKVFTSVYLKNYNSYIVVYDRNINFEKPYSEISRFSNHYFPVCLSVFEIPPAQTNEELLYGTSAIKSSPFYQFVGDTTGGVNLDSLKIAYITKHRIDYLFLEQGNSFEKQLCQLPIEKRYSLENEEYDIIKFDWRN